MGNRNHSETNFHECPKFSFDFVFENKSKKLTDIVTFSLLLRIYFGFLVGHLSNYILTPAVRIAEVA